MATPAQRREEAWRKLQQGHRRRTTGTSKTKPKRNLELWRGGAVAVQRGRRKRVYSPTPASAARVQRIARTRPKRKIPEGIRISGFKEH